LGLDAAGGGRDSDRKGRSFQRRARSAPIWPRRRRRSFSAAKQQLAALAVQR
jgi:hypothetical protein